MSVDNFTLLGYMVILPDYFRGKMIDPHKEPMEDVIAFTRTHFNWAGKMKEDWEKKVKPYAEKHGAKTFGAIGKYLIRKESNRTELNHFQYQQLLISNIY